MGGGACTLRKVLCQKESYTCTLYTLTLLNEYIVKLQEYTDDIMLSNLTVRERNCLILRVFEIH